MAMIRCPKCGEKYSDTYKECPFCEEEEALLDGEEIRRSPKRGRRAAHSRQFSLITPTLIVLIFLMAGLLIYLLYGDKLTEKFGGEKAPENPVEEVKPGTMPEEPGDQSGTMPEEPDAPVQEPEQSGEQDSGDYDTAARLPDGLRLSTTDFTLKTLGETHTIQVSGGSSTYRWISQDEGIASVDQSGKVVAVSNGTVNVLVTDGSKKAVCIVRVNAPGGTAATTPTTPAAPAESGSLRAGSAVVINGGNGVRVRSGPGTDSEVLATVPNGADIQIVESAGNGWYKITFSGVGGVKTTGYMKGEFLKNN
ncbi:SH3 domain-containing protein [Dysosmobacter sp.]|uniref:SH3 domain-containing protein n=1 Tax=Dysosmobacter sp. TaxID=2591382 RepID=UPI002A97836C|nr:SH3 domain-containing protein [Dysosmobacter sp.]MDY5612442.1 SH3 domain-containing protein [Dysosmobacter sp.]